MGSNPRYFSSPPVSPRFFPALSLALFFARAPLSERLEQANRFQDRRGSALLLYRNRPEISILSVNKSPIRYGFRAGPRAIRYRHSLNAMSSAAAFILVAKQKFCRKIWQKYSIRQK